MNYLRGHVNYRIQTHDLYKRTAIFANYHPNRARLTFQIWIEILKTIFNNLKKIKETFFKASFFF